VNCDSGRIAICIPLAARASLYGGAGDSSDRTLGWCERRDVCEGCDLVVGWLRTDVALDERPPIKSSASKLKTRRCLAHLLPRGSPFEAADSESSLLLLRANMTNAIIMPRPINATGTATAACTPGEHIPLHDFASETTSAALVVVEAGAGEVKDVLNVEPVGDVIEVEIGELDATKVFDVTSAVLARGEDVCAVDVDAFVDALVDVALPAADVLEVLPPGASVTLVAASGVVAGGGVAVSTPGVVVKNFCVARKDDMAAGVVKIAGNEKVDASLLNELDIVSLFRPSRPIPRSLPVQTRDPGLRVLTVSTAPEVLADTALAMRSQSGDIRSIIGHWQRLISEGWGESGAEKRQKRRQQKSEVKKDAGREVVVCQTGYAVAKPIYKQAED
jgi:hypothetical protein